MDVCFLLSDSDIGHFKCFITLLRISEFNKKTPKISSSSGLYELRIKAIGLTHRPANLELETKKNLQPEFWAYIYSILSL